MQQDLVSILIPFKNTGSYLKECLESIISQTYERWELLIIDDHSTDNSSEIVRAYSQKDPRITLLPNQGNGIIAALKTAFDASKGQFITRMDSDDIMHPKKLQIMADQLVKHGRGHVALGLVKYFGKQGISDGYHKYEKWLNGLSKMGTNYQEIYKECVIPSPCWMLHREDLVKCGAFNTYRYPEDYDLAFRLYEQQIKCLPSQHLLHYWRDYEARTSRNHEHYAQNHFLELKLHYFLKLHYESYRPLVLWGAGRKGKIVASNLQTPEIDFVWICDNPKKIGKHIYDTKMHHFDHLKSLDKVQCIVAVANPQAQIEIREYFESNGLQPNRDYFFFC